jgi:hypothetical protein
MNDGPSEALVEAVAALWRMPASSENLRSTSAFKWLSKTVQTDYPSAHDEATLNDSALDHALCTLGLPCQLPAGMRVAPAHPEEAARLLDRAFRATRHTLWHLVPLDRAAVLPDVAFGPVRLGKFSEIHLRELANATRLERLFPDLPFDARRFSDFQWLVVEEELALDPRPAARASPLLYEVVTARDLGQVEPHKGRFPPAVEKALFAVLLAPWEEWSTEQPDWRGFRAPWVYTVDEDIFAPLKPPPSAETLTWETYDDEFSEHIEFFRPRLDAGAMGRGLAVLDDAYWSPVVHFFVHAFLSEGIDEFVAHMTTIEAALGLRDDYRRKKATDQVAARVAALLADGSAFGLYKKLFAVRCDYVHGRPMNAILSKERTDARSLARRVAEVLVRTSEMRAPRSREEFLKSLSDRGATMLPAEEG